MLPQGIQSRYASTGHTIEICFHRAYNRDMLPQGIQSGKANKLPISHNNVVEENTVFQLNIF